MAKMKKLLLQLAGVLLLAGLAPSSWAQEDAPLEVVVDTAVDKPLPIAVVPFRSSGAVAEDIAQIITEDLLHSGRFAPMARGDMLSQPGDVAEVKFDDWRKLSMPHLVIGKVTPASGSYEIEFRLLEVFSGKQMTGFKVNAPEQRLRFTAHQIADIIYQQLLGQKGAFATRIAYVAVRGRGKIKQYTMQVADADGHNPKALLTSPWPIMSPAWSPDGSKLAYVSFEGRNSAVYVQDVSTGKRAAVASGSGINSAPAWSPDGSRLALTRSVEGNPEIYVMSAGGGSTTRLTNDPAIDTEPVWSSDGTRIAFTSDRGGGPQIYEMASHGGAAQRLTFSQGAYHARPRYSPDGANLAMVHGSGSGFQIAALNLRSGEFRVLSNGSQDESPSFAPNGSMIMYADGNALAATSSDGRVKQRIPAVGGYEVREPAWGPFLR